MSTRQDPGTRAALVTAIIVALVAALVLLAALLAPPSAHAAAVRAFTEDGRAVLLHEDGTWAFEPAPAAGHDQTPPLPTPNRPADAPPPLLPEPQSDTGPGVIPDTVPDGLDHESLPGQALDEPRIFERDGSQDAVVNGERAAYQFWYDQTRWFLKQENDEPLSEYEFVDASTLVQAMTVAYPFQGTVDDLQRKVLATIQATDPEALAIFQEDRAVNARPVRCMHVKASVAGEPFVFYFYLHVSGGMAVQAACFTAEDVFHAMYGELTQFMNGFVAP